MTGPASKELLARYRDGDDEAARAIFDRYVQRLIALTRQRIAPRLAQRIDPEDVIQSAYRSFFVHARQGDYVLNRAGDLWRLLAAITIHKLHGQVELHTAQRRNMNREEQFGDDAARPARTLPIDADPTPDETASVVEQLQALMAESSPNERRVLELRLQGSTIEEISEEISRSQRTVRRLLENVRVRLEERLHDAS